LRKSVFLLLILMFPCSLQAQISYLSKYKSAIYVEGLGMGPFFSLGYEHAPVRKLKNFTAFRTGVGFIFESDFSLRNVGVTLPVSVTKSLVVNNLKKRVKHRVSLRCNAQPPKFATEWFSEFGMGYTPAFYSKTDIRHRVYGLIGLRQQIVINIPPRPKVYYLKVQYTPYYTYFNNKHNFEFLPKFDAVVAGVSLGFSVR
jgi:hypothetical protein